MHPYNFFEVDLNGTGRNLETSPGSWTLLSHNWSRRLLRKPCLRYGNRANGMSGWRCRKNKKSFSLK